MINPSLLQYVQQCTVRVQHHANWGEINIWPWAACLLRAYSSLPHVGIRTQLFVPYAKSRPPHPSEDIFLGSNA